jgi:hypothetical protein
VIFTGQVSLASKLSPQEVAASIGAGVTPVRVDALCTGSVSFRTFRPGESALIVVDTKRDPLRW